MLLNAPPPNPATIALVLGGTIPEVPLTVSAVVPVAPEPFVTVIWGTSVPWCVEPNVSV